MRRFILSAIAVVALTWSPLHACDGAKGTSPNGMKTGQFPGKPMMTPQNMMKNRPGQVPMKQKPPAQQQQKPAKQPQVT